MKRCNALMLGTALAAALSFAQTDKPAATKPAATAEKTPATAPVKAKKHKKHAKKMAASTPATPATPAMPATPAAKK